MRIAVAGKGGVGKTTIAGTLARALGRRGNDVLAFDADVNPMLGISLGVGAERTEQLVAVRQALDEATDDAPAEHASGFQDLVDRFGTDAPDGVRLAVVTEIQNPEPGCP